MLFKQKNPHIIAIKYIECGKNKLDGVAAEKGRVEVLPQLLLVIFVVAYLVVQYQSMSWHCGANATPRLVWNRRE